MQIRDKEEFLFECDAHDHTHDDGDHDGELVLTTTYLAEHQVYAMNIITGLLHYSDDFVYKLAMGAENTTHPLATLHITTMDDKVHIMMIDADQAINMVTLLLEWIVRMDEEEGGEE